MPVLRATLGFTGRQDHLRGLRSPVSQNDIESLAEAKSLMLHAIAGLPKLRWSVPALEPG